MRWLGTLILCCGAVFGHVASGAEEAVATGITRVERPALPADIAEQSFAPPPVPQFMLEKPQRSLSMDEMIRQAREAEQRAGAGAPSPGSDRPESPGSGR